MTRLDEHVLLTDEDRRLSPGSGLTRQHWVRAADHLLDGVRPFRSAYGTHIDLPGSPARAGLRSDGLEGFARTFLLAAFRTAGTGTSPHIADYTEGLAHGPRGRGAQRWQEISHVGWAGQPMVESASIALGLLVAREHSWDALDGRQQDRLEAWLRGSLTHQPAANNWYLFPLTVSAFLESVGRGDAATKAATERAISLLERWYRGDGWYSDGDGRAFDHYIGWAFHFYPPLLLSQTPGSIGIDADRHEQLRIRYADRLEAFLKTYAETFDQNGAPMYVGRSLSYRFATTAAIGSGAATGRLGIAPGRARRIASSALRYFLERGALSGGLLSRGWHGPHGASLQNYSGPASPYWASKAFASLLAPADAPFWTAPESPDDQGERTVAIPQAGWLLQRTADGHVRLHNHGSDHVSPDGLDAAQSDPLYARYGYSTRTGPTAIRNVADNHVALVVRGVPSVRHVINPIAVGDDWAASWHRPGFPVPVATGGGTVVTAPVLPSAAVTAVTIARGQWDVRIFRFDEVPDGTAVTATGWALALASPADATIDVDTRAIRVSAAEANSELRLLAGEAAFSAERAPAGTAYGRYALVPQATAVIDGSLLVLATRTSTGGEIDQPPTAVVDGSLVLIRWRNGIHRLRMREKNVDVEFETTEAEA